LNILYVCIGGALGSLARFLIQDTLTKKYKKPFPLSTFIINISGSFLLGLTSSCNLNNELKLLISIGFLGGFTTFSTFMNENYNLLYSKKSIISLIYISLSIFLGIVGYIFGSKF